MHYGLNRSILLCERSIESRLSNGSMKSALRSSLCDRSNLSSLVQLLKKFGKIALIRLWLRLIVSSYIKTSSYLGKGGDVLKYLDVIVRQVKMAQVLKCVDTA
jgi:hypothetical protein